MKKLFALFAAALLTFSLAAEENRTIPVKDFQWKLKNVPPEKAGGVDALVKSREDTLSVKGEKIPARTFDLKYSRGNSVELIWTSDSPIDLMNDFREMRTRMRISGGIPLHKVVKIELGNSLGQWTPTGLADQGEGLWSRDWDAGHETAWNYVIDLRKFDRIRITLKMDAELPKKISTQDANKLEKPADAKKDLEDDFEMKELAAEGMLDMKEAVRLEKVARKEINSFRKAETVPVKEVSVTNADIGLTKNNHWEKDPVLKDRGNRWEKWVKFLDSYQPDYSDSSKMLEPPQTGRLSAALPLAVNGKPNAEIIVTKDTYGVIDTTAKELQYWVKEISGATLPIVEKSGAMPVKIHLNDPSVLKRFPEDEAFLKDLKPHFGADGYLVKTEGNDIYIAGVIPKGVMNGMYRFLENNTTIIFARGDSTFGTVYDTDPNLKIIWGEGRDKPRTPFRGWRGVNSAWSARNCANSPLPLEWGGRFEQAGLFEEYVPDEPPYQVWADDKYYKFGYYNSQICLGPHSLEKTIETMMKRVQELKDKGTPPDSIDWVTEDNWRVCTCKDCVKPIKLPDGTVLTSSGESFKEHMAPEEQRFRSNQYYLFANELARALKKNHPGVKLQLLAYFFMEPAPDIELEDNIQIIFAPLYTRPDYRNPIFAPSNNTVWNNRRALLNKKRPMELYEYYFWTPNADVMKADIEDYIESGFEHVGSEINKELGGGFDCWYAWDFTAIDFWAFNRLAWDYTQSAEQLNKYFIRRVYREAAPAVEKLYGLIKTAFYKGIRGNHGFSFQNFIVSGIFETGHGEELSKELHESLAKVKNPIARINLGRLLRQYDSMLDAWMIRTGKRPAPAAQTKKATMTIPAKKQTQVRDQIMSSWMSAEGVSHRITTIEMDGKFIDVARFRFDLKDMKKKNTEMTSMFHSKWMGDETPIPLVGTVAFKMRMRTPFKGLPFFGVWGHGKEFDNPEKDAMKISKDTWEVHYLPTGKYVNLDDIYGFNFMCPKNYVDPATGYLEFDVYDVRLEPMSTGEKMPADTEILDIDAGF